jgi:hypothetical protein
MDSLVNLGLQNAIPDPEIVQIVPNEKETARPFPCNFCSNIFTTIGHLLDHIHRIHEKPRFSCTLCQKSFTKESFLKKHVSVDHRSLPMRKILPAIPQSIKPDAFSILANLKPIPSIPVRTDVLPANMVSSPV